MTNANKAKHTTIVVDANNKKIVIDADNRVGNVYIILMICITIIIVASLYFKRKNNDKDRT